MIEPVGSSGFPRALVVDDDVVSRRLMGACLVRDGMVVDEVPDASSALRALERHRYEVVLLDLCLGTGANGLDVLRALRRASERHTTPVILVSGSARDTNAIALALDRGADDYLVKPLCPVELRARVTALRRRGNLVSELTRRSHDLELAATRSVEQLRRAATSQRAALPVTPFSSGSVRASGEVIASESVSGDAFDLITAADGSVAALVADVAGHGPGAAMLATALIAAMRGPLMEGRGLAASAAAGDRFLRSTRSDLQTPRVASVAMARVEPAARSVELLNAAMPAIAIVAPDGQRTWVESSGRPLGLGPAHAYATVRMGFGPGAWLALASDGALSGDQDVEATAALLARASASGTWLATARPTDIEALLREHLGLAAQTPPADDATLLFVANLGAEETER